MLEQITRIIEGIYDNFSYTSNSIPVKFYEKLFCFFDVITDNAAIVYGSIAVLVTFMAVLLSTYKTKKHRSGIDMKQIPGMPAWMYPFSFIVSSISSKTIDFLPFFHKRLSIALSLTSSIISESQTYMEEFASIAQTTTITPGKIASYFYCLTQEEWKEVLSIETDYSFLAEHLHDTLVQIKYIPVFHLDITIGMYKYGKILCILMIILFIWMHLVSMTKKYTQKEKIMIIIVGLLSMINSIYLPLVFSLQYCLMCGTGSALYSLLKYKYKNNKSA